MNPDSNQPTSTPPQPPEQPVTPAPLGQPAPLESAPLTVTPPAPTTPEPAAANPFAQPTTVIGSAPAGAPIATPNGSGNGSKKKLIILLSAIIGGIVLLAGIGLVIYFLFFNVTKADYQKAYDQMKVVRDGVDAKPSVSSSEDSMTLVKEKFETYKTENAKLGDLKAFRGDSELREKYSVYDKKAKAYIAFMEGYIPSLEKFMVAIKAAGSAGTFTSAGVQKTIDAYEQAKDVTDPTLKEYITATLAYYKGILPQVRAYESASTSTAKLAAIREISAASSQLSTASKKFSTDLKARTDDISPTESFDELGKLVTKKLNES